MKNYFIIHGTFGHNKENWFGWLEDVLKNKEFNVYNFNYPTPEGHNFKNWSNVLNLVQEYISEDSVFICHSSASIFLVKYCLQNNIKIGRLISVSGFNNYIGGHPEFDDINKDMFVDDVSRFVDLCRERICIYSIDDPYISLDASSKFAKSLEASEVVYENAGHFNEKSGYSTFEDILNYL